MLKYYGYKLRAKSESLEKYQPLHLVLQEKVCGEDLEKAGSKICEIGTNMTPRNFLTMPITNTTLQW